MIACPLPASSMDAGQADAIGMGIVWQAQGAIMGLAVEEAGTAEAGCCHPPCLGTAAQLQGSARSTYQLLLCVLSVFGLRPLWPLLEGTGSCLSTCPNPACPSV